MVRASFASLSTLDWTLYLPPLDEFSFTCIPVNVKSTIFHFDEKEMRFYRLIHTSCVRIHTQANSGNIISFLPEFCETCESRLPLALEKSNVQKYTAAFSLYRFQEGDGNFS